jgi:hypothetical protein
MSKRINNYITVSTSPSIQISNTNTIGNLFTTGGNVGINTINPNFTLDVSGTARITTSLTTGTISATSLTTSNAVFTNTSTGTINASTISTGTLRSTDLFLSGTLTTVNITTQNLLVTSSSSTLGSLLVSNGNLNISSGALNVSGNISSSSTISGNAFTGGSLSISGTTSTSNLVATTSTLASLFSSSITTSSLFSTSITTSSLLVSGGNINISGANFNLSTPSGLIISSGNLQIQGRISSLGYQYNSSSINGNAVTTSMNVINKRIKSSRAAAVSAVSTWTTRNLTTTGFWPAICWSSELSLFVAGNNSNTSSCQTSPDGITWTARTLGTTIQAWDVIWSSELSLFVMTNSASSTNPFQTSPDGITWTTRTTGSAYPVTGICWSPELGIFVACAGASGALVSSNGTSWTAYAISGSTPSNQRVCWSAELNLFVMTNGGSGFFYSSNGISWTPVSFTSLGGMQAICWSAELNLFVAGGSIASTSTFATSPDAINWTVRTSPVTSIIHNNIIWSPELSLFVTASNGYTFSSHDGINWTTRSSSLNGSVFSCCWSPELSIFVLSQAGNSNVIYTSNIGLSTNQNTILRSQMTLTSSGNFGINTVSPEYNLDVVGSGRFINSTSTNTFASLIVGGPNANSRAPALQTTGSTVLIYNAAPAVGVITNIDLSTFHPSISAGIPTTRISLLDLGLANNSFNLLTRTPNSVGTSMASRIFIDGSGLVGINTTSPTYTLDVNGGIRLQSNFNGGGGSNYTVNYNSGSSAYGITSIGNDTGSNLSMFLNSSTRTVDGGVRTATLRNDGGLLRLQSSAGTGISVNTTGNVGIGTDIPGETLSVSGPIRTIGGTGILNFYNAAQTTRFGYLYHDGTNMELNNQQAGSIFFSANNSEKMRVSSSGNVGIGITAPSNTLHVNGSINVSSTTIPTNAGYNSDTNFISLGTLGYAISDTGIFIGDNVVSARWRLRNGNNRLNLAQNNGSGAYTDRGYFENSTGVYTSLSDFNLKKDIKTIDNCLDNVMKLNPVSYLMKSQETSEKRSIGFIAQEVLKIIPEVVGEPKDENDIYGLYYTSIIPILTKAIQELVQKIDSQQIEINNLIEITKN